MGTVARGWKTVALGLGREDAFAVRNGWKKRTRSGEAALNPGKLETGYEGLSGACRMVSADAQVVVEVAAVHVPGETSRNGGNCQVGC